MDQETETGRDWRGWKDSRVEWVLVEADCMGNQVVAADIDAEELVLCWESPVGVWIEAARGCVWNNTGLFKKRRTPGN